MNIIEAIKESWSWAGIDPEEVVGENDFGNLVIRDTTGKFWRFCPEDVYCKIIAENRKELDELASDQSFIADWYMINIVNEAKHKLGQLQHGRKYHLAIPGALGGAYSAENIQSISQLEQIRFSGDIGQHIQNLPDGAQIQLKVVD